MQWIDRQRHPGNLYSHRLIQFAAQDYASLVETLQPADRDVISFDDSPRRQAVLQAVCKETLQTLCSGAQDLNNQHICVAIDYQAGQPIRLGENQPPCVVFALQPASRLDGSASLSRKKSSAGISSPRVIIRKAIKESWL